MNPDTLVEGNTPASPSSSASPSTWTISEHEGFWVSGSSAGGSRRYNSMSMTSCYVIKSYPQLIAVLMLLFFVFSSESFWKNPQFQLVLAEQDLSDNEDEDDSEDDDEDDDEVMTPEEDKRTEKQKQKAKQCTVLVELLQKNRRQKDKVHFLYVAFHVYKVT